MQWFDLFAALALMLVIEGIIPFANPRAMRRTFELLARQPDKALRTGGLISMIAGLLLLYVVRH